MIGAETMWGLMAPVGKFVLSGAVITPLLMTDFRMIGSSRHCSGLYSTKAPISLVWA